MNNIKNNFETVKEYTVTKKNFFSNENKSF